MLRYMLAGPCFIVLICKYVAWPKSKAGPAKVSLAGPGRARPGRAVFYCWARPGRTMFY